MVKFYCHYDSKNNEIIQIGPNSDCDVKKDTIKSFIIPEKKALSILSGETNSSDWEILTSCGKEILVNKQVKYVEKKNPVEIQKLKECDLLLTVQNKEICFDIKNLSKIDELNSGELFFFITKKKDITILYDEFKINIFEGNQNIPIKNIGEDFSIFTYPNELTISL